MMKKLSRPFELKAVGDDGTFEGYGSVFHVVDSYKDVVLPGAFTDTITEHNEKQSMPALLWQHDSAEPIGVWESVVEDEHGLKMSGRFALDVQRGREAHSLLKMGAVKGLSIGYSIPKGGEEFDKDAGVNNLKQIKLFETSLVTFPANESAQVTQVRANLEDGIYPSIREVEKFLRDAGFSKKDSHAIISKGYRDFVERDAAELLALEQLTDNLRRLTK